MCRCFITNDYVFILQAYIHYVRPILEYNSSIWNPHTNYIGNAKALERVQRLFTKRLFYRIYSIYVILAWLLVIIV